MISIGTLLAFYLVDNALIYHWYAKIGTSMPLHVLIFLFLLKLSQSPYWGRLMGGADGDAFFRDHLHDNHHSLPLQTWQDSGRPPLDWLVPMMPWPVATSVFLNVFLIAPLKARSYQRFGIWSLVIIVFGVHSTYTAEENEIVNATTHHVNLDIS
jgi:hypothetical protein